MSINHLNLKSNQSITTSKRPTGRDRETVSTFSSFFSNPKQFHPSVKAQVLQGHSDF
jgi:hypothetical protein